MDPILLSDVFAGDAFTALSLSTAISIVPNQYGRVNELGLFKDQPVSTTVAMLEFDNQVVNLIPTTPRGTPAPKSKTGKRTAKALNIPRIALDDMILPEDIQNVRQFGQMALKTVESETNNKLISLARKHDITHEFLKCGALSGIIIDADGSTLLNLFTEFGVAEQSVNFNFTDANLKIRAKADEVKRKVQLALMGDTMTHVHALCSPEFWDGFINHESVARAYENYQNVVATVAGAATSIDNPLRNDVRKGFYFAGMVWEEYLGEATYLNGATTVNRKFIEAGAARFFPVGTSETFINHQAPASWFETVNTPGMKKYGKVVVDNGNRFAEVLSESAPLPICTRPLTLVKGTGTYV